MPLARAELEQLLRDRRLDHTLSSAVPPLHPHDEFSVTSTSVAAFDAFLDGGFPRGQLSELVGPRSAGRASVLHRMLSAATARGELVALVDVLDTLAVASAAASGVDLDRVLWIRGEVTSTPGRCHDANQRAMVRAVQALTLVLQAGNFGLVTFDVAEAPIDVIRRLPFTTWLRLQRMIDGSQTTCVLVGDVPIARSSGGMTVKLEPRGGRFRGRLLAGLNFDVRVVRACGPSETASRLWSHEHWIKTGAGVAPAESLRNLKTLQAKPSGGSREGTGVGGGAAVTSCSKYA